jgi:hypothetical protein
MPRQPRRPLTEGWRLGRTCTLRMMGIGTFQRCQSTLGMGMKDGPTTLNYCKATERESSNSYITFPTSLTDCHRLEETTTVSTGTVTVVASLFRVSSPTPGALGTRWSTTWGICMVSFYIYSILRPEDTALKSKSSSPHKARREALEAEAWS